MKIYDFMMKCNKRQVKIKAFSMLDTIEQVYEFIVDEIEFMEIGENMEIDIKLIDRKEI